MKEGDAVSDKDDPKKPYMTPGARRVFIIGMSTIAAVLIVTIILRIAAG